LLLHNYKKREDKIVPNHMPRIPCYAGIK